MKITTESRRLTLTPSEIDCLIALCRIEPATIRALGKLCTSHAAAIHAIERLYRRGLLSRFKQQRPPALTIADELAGRASTPAKGKPPYLYQLTVPGRRIATDLWRAAQAVGRHERRKADEARGKEMLRDPLYTVLR